jgi:hypothetical protein
VIAPEDWTSIESTIDALTVHDDGEPSTMPQGPAEPHAEEPELSLEPVEEESKPVKKDLVARLASVTARFVAVVAAILLIAVVTNVLREMQLRMEVELAVHGTTATVLIFLLYYVWIKTRVTD